jgi:ATP-dependent DNA ligase
MFDIPIVEAPTSKVGRREGIMLCYPFSEDRLVKWRAPYIMQPKLDGVRCRAIINDTQVILYSSEMHIIDLVPHINEELLRLFNGRFIELDGELYCHGMSFQDIISRTSRSRNKHSDSGKIDYHVFDAISSNQPQVARLTWLSQLFQDWVKDDSCVKYVEPSLARDITVVMEKFAEYIDSGYEGFVIREPYGLYKRKRSTEIMKFKPHQTDEYVIVGTQEEMSIDGFPKNSLGAFVCISDGVIFNVGTGPSLTQERRINLWKDKDDLLGRKLKVKYQTLTQGKSIPRFPVALEVI